MNPKAKKEYVKEPFETPRVTNLEGEEIALKAEELEEVSGGAAGREVDVAVKGHLCLGGG